MKRPYVPVAPIFLRGSVPPAAMAAEPASPASYGPSLGSFGPQAGRPVTGLAPLRRGPVRGSAVRGSAVRGNPLCVVYAPALGLAGPPISAASAALALGALLTECRAQIHGRPLKIAAWDAARSRAFFGVLTPLLRSRETIWIAPPDGSPGISSASLPACAVPLRVPEDERLWEEMTCDLLFCPACDSKEASLVAQMKGRTRAVVVDPQGPHFVEVCSTSQSQRLNTYSWWAEEESRNADQ